MASAGWDGGRSGVPDVTRYLPVVVLSRKRFAGGGGRSDPRIVCDGCVPPAAARSSASMSSGSSPDDGGIFGASASLDGADTALIAGEVASVASVVAGCGTNDMLLGARRRWRHRPERRRGRSRRHRDHLRRVRRVGGAVDYRVELAVAKRDEHRLVLLLHHLADDLGHPVGADVLDVARLHALQDSPAVHEEVRDDVTVAGARVLRLDMEHPALVTDVVIVSEQGRRILRRHGRCRGDAARNLTVSQHRAALASPPLARHVPRSACCRQGGVRPSGRRVAAGSPAVVGSACAAAGGDPAVPPAQRTDLRGTEEPNITAGGRPLAASCQARLADDGVEARVATGADVG